MPDSFLDLIKDPELRKRIEASRKSSGMREGAVPTNLFEDPAQFVKDVGSNVITDVTNIAKGIANLPAFAGQLISHPVDTVSEVAKSFLHQYTNLFSRPLDTLGQRPISALLDLTGLWGVTAKTLRIAAVAGVAGKENIVAQALNAFYERGLSEAQLMANDIVRSKAANIRVGTHKALTQMRETQKRISKYKGADEDLIYAMQRTHNPKLDLHEGASVLDVEKRLADKLGADVARRELAALREGFDAHREMMNQSGLLRYVETKENYITQLFIPKPGAVLDRALMDKAVKLWDEVQPMARPSGWKDYVEALEKAGLQPKYPSATKLLAWYEHTSIAALEHSRAINEMLKAGIIRRDNPGGWKPVRHESLINAYQEQKIIIRERQARGLSPAKAEEWMGGKPPKEVLMPRKGAKQKGIEAAEQHDMPPSVPPFVFKGGKEAPLAKGAVAGEQKLHSLYMHPDAIPAWKALTESRFNGDLATNFSMINAVAKKTALALSLFHHGALTESAAAVLGVRGLPLPIVKQKGLKAMMPHKKGLELMQDAEFSNELALRGVLGREVIDAQTSLAHEALKKAGAVIDAKIGGTFGSKVTEKVGALMVKWDTALWDHYHTGLKAYAYYSLKERMMAKYGKRFTPEEIQKAVASHVNDAFGGLNWEEMLVSAKAQQQLSWILLAPDWTLANIRIAGRPLVNAVRGARKALTGKGRGLDTAEKAINLTLGAAYWRNMILSQWLFGNVTNKLFSAYAATQKDPNASPLSIDLSKGHWMHENDPGNETEIISPFGKDEKGRNVYIKVGKQWREPMRWLQNPIEMGAVKGAPLIQAIVEQVTGSTMSGYPASFKDKPFWESLPQRAGAVGKKFVPISQVGLSSSSFATIAPQGAATTGFKLVKMYKSALEFKEYDRLASINRLAANNGYDAKTLMNLARRELAREKKKSK